MTDKTLKQLQHDEERLKSKIEKLSTQLKEERARLTDLKAIIREKKAKDKAASAQKSAKKTAKGSTAKKSTKKSTSKNARKAKKR